MSSIGSRRFLHFVFKVADRKETIRFYRSVLGMKVLRHEEFEEGCKASCNGPYDGKWSKTMVGYGPEDDHFVMELTYNYGIKNYKLGNDFLGVVIKSSEAVQSAKDNGWNIVEENDLKVVEAPGGYKFFLLDEARPTDTDPVMQVILSSSNLKRSVDYWSGVLGMEVYENGKQRVVLGYNQNECKLVFQNTGFPVEHAEAYGRIAFSCPTDELPTIQSKVKAAGGVILTPLVSLDTPGKATVHVVILADPDGHEICFVGDEAFRELSQIDLGGDKLLDDAIEADKSDEWFAKRALKKKD